TSASRARAPWSARSRSAAATSSDHPVVVRAYPPAPEAPVLTRHGRLFPIPPAIRYPMKRTAFALVLGAAALVPCAASAQGYVGIGGGYGHTSIACGDVHPCIRDNPGWKLTAGYRLGYGLAAEAGVIDFGEVTEGASPSPSGEMRTLAAAV